jgi:NADH dehydrogenase
MRVLIVGGGFGGLNAARALRGPPFDVTLVDKRNFHLFQPLLYQVATGGLSAANIAAPLRSILERQRNARVLLAEVTGFSTEERTARTRDGSIGYDVLVVAAGMRNHYFGNDAWEAHAPGLKTLEDAANIRSRILHAFEAAERAMDEEEAGEFLRFVVVGGGPTGVELAGTLGEIARYTLRHEFRRIDPARAEILLVEAGPRVLPTFHDELSARAARDLKRLGVTVCNGTMITDVAPGRVTLKAGESERTVAARTVVWAAGVRSSPLADKLRGAFGAELDRQGRVLVTAQLHLPQRPDVFVIGDMARPETPDGEPLPGVAPVAMQQGQHVARVLRARRAGRTAPPFRYRDYGAMATIGRRAAVAEIGRFRFRGVLAWLMWLFVHLINLVLFEKRILVLVQWAWNYITFSRTSRIIVREFPKDD